MKYCYATLVLMPFLANGVLRAQQIPGTVFNDPAPHPERPAILENTLPGGAAGRWWRNPLLMHRLGLTPDQQKNMDEIFDQSRLKLIDLTAALDKEEVVLEPLVDADQPDAPKVRAQIDRIAQARAELEKANASLLLGIRLILTLGQWRELELHPNISGPWNRRFQNRSDDSSASPARKKEQQ